jgi:antitoxin ParD1/3/4
MAGIERLTITLPSDMVAVVKGAVAGGDYASSSEGVREALRDWKMKRALQLQELAVLKGDIDKGLTDLAEGRVKDFDADRIIERGRKLLASRSTFAWPMPPSPTSPSRRLTPRPTLPNWCLSC